MAVSHALAPGVVLGDEFEIVRPIGQGGMGTVYEAVQRTTGAARALKIMRSSLSADPRFRARFDQEARVCSRINSDHVVQVIRAGVDDATHVPWLAMELLEGENLDSWLSRNGPMPQPEAQLLLRQLFHAMAAAHAVSVVHRDLKPENVFLGRSRVVGVPFMVKVLDFGVAKIVSEARGATVAVGTPAYMAPEQTSSLGEVSAQADVWALGLLVFQLLVGKPYWRSMWGEAGPVQLWREVLVDPIVAASERAGELGRAGLLPEGFDGWFSRCVVREIDGRYADAQQAFDALSPLFAHDVQPGARVANSIAAPGGGPLVTGSEPTAFGGASGRGGSASAATGKASQLEAAAVDTASKRTTVKVTFREPKERVVVDGERGATLLEVSTANGIPHHHACGGRARCTTCRVVVLEGQAAAGPRTPAEVKVATARKWPAPIRLACQLRVLGDISVRRLVVDDDDLQTVNASVSSEEPAVEEGVAMAAVLPGFDAFSLEQFPHDAVHVLNRYLRQICEPAFANRGAIVRYEPSGVLLLFGGDRPVAEALQDAVRSALRAQARVRQLNSYVLRHFGQQFELTVGLHAGRVVRASVGHPARLEQVVLGDGVEGALKAAAVASEQGVRVLATDATIAAAPELLRVGRRVSGVVSGAEVLDFARADVIYLVQSTFERLGDRGGAFAGRFYERFFDADPEIAPLFTGTDMATQKEMLMDVLATAIRGLDRFDDLVPTLHALGARHVGYGVRSSHYRTLGRVLLETLEEFLGPEFTPEVHLAWMEIYGALAREMLAGARPDEGHD